MLYERWSEIAKTHSAEWALREPARTWTFGELWEAGEVRATECNGVAFPQGNGAEFIVSLLAAWREKGAACPLEGGQARPDIAALPDNCAHVKITSGTGGHARHILFTGNQLAADADNIVETMGLRADWPNLGIISLAHSYGFSNLVLPLLLHGIPLVLTTAPLPEMVRQAAKEYASITIAAVPAIWRALHSADAIPPGTRLAISAGAPLPLELELEVFRTRGLKLHNFLGSTECGGIAYDATATPRADAALAGTPLRNVGLSVHESGCLTIQGRAVGETYWPEPLESLRNGTFQTSDLAELKGEEVYLRGRMGDQINVAGRKLSPEAVERVLLAHPEVRECLVLGVPSRNAERMDTIVAVVVSQAPEAELKEFLLASLPAWQVPRFWKFVPAIALNSRGKPSRADWRQRLVADDSALR